MTVRLKFEGGPQLEAALKSLGGAIASRLGQNSVNAGARVIAADAKLRVPVRTGALKRSIRVFTNRADRSGSIRTAYVGSRLPYAHLVENGTRHSSAKPFLRPALDEAATRAIDKLIENLSNGITRELAKRPVPEDQISEAGE